MSSEISAVFMCFIKEIKREIGVFSVNHTFPPVSKPSADGNIS